MDHNRLAILLAMLLHRHGGLQMADQDVFINVVGGVKVETSADLALYCWRWSPVSRIRHCPEDLVNCSAEVDLSGEIRQCRLVRSGCRRAAKHGFHRAIVPARQCPKHPIRRDGEVVPVKTVKALRARCNRPAL